MKVIIELCAGDGEMSRYRVVTKRDMDLNIEAVDRAIKGKPQCKDFVTLLDTRSILEGIREQLPD